MVQRDVAQSRTLRAINLTRQVKSQRVHLLSQAFRPPREKTVMRALHVPAAGEQPQLSDLPVPEVTEGTVLIRVKAAGLNGFDNAVAAGMLTEMLPHEYPLVLGRDAAGVVEAIGAGVDHVAVGDEVIGHVLMAPPMQAGTLAEYALVSGGRRHRQAGRAGLRRCRRSAAGRGRRGRRRRGHRPAARTGRAHQRRLRRRRLVRHPAAHRPRRHRRCHGCTGGHRAADQPRGKHRHRLHVCPGRANRSAPPTRTASTPSSIWSATRPTGCRSTPCARVGR